MSRCGFFFFDIDLRIQTQHGKHLPTQSKIHIHVPYHLRYLDATDSDINIDINIVNPGLGKDVIFEVNMKHTDIYHS
jgi:hypothetical protein